MRPSEQLADTANKFIDRNRQELGFVENVGRYELYKTTLTSHPFGIFIGLIVLIALAVGNMLTSIFGIDVMAAVVSWWHVIAVVSIFLVLCVFTETFRKILLAIVGAVVTLGLTILIWAFLPIPFQGANVYIALILFMFVAFGVYGVMSSIYSAITGREIE